MHPESKTRLAEHLHHMQAHAATLPVLFMRVRNTVDGMLAGCIDGALELDYPCARGADIARSGQFLAFCRQHDLPVTKERWGDYLVYRAALGADIAHAVALIAHCFQAVYGHSGQFALDLKGDAGQPRASASRVAPALRCQS